MGGCLMLPDEGPFGKEPLRMNTKEKELLRMVQMKSNTRQEAGKPETARGMRGSMR